MNETSNNAMRFDLQVISSWIAPGSRVLDLGCGHGDLLYSLQQEKQVQGVGFEADEEKAAFCISRGLSVLHENFNEDVLHYPRNHFDYCVLSQTLQQVYEPSKLIRDMLRVGKMGIVSFPNFSHWKIRTHLLFTGCAPVTSQLPYEWYNTPNIRIVTIKDFRRFSKEAGFEILKETAINTNNKDRKGNIIRVLPGLRATYGIFLIGKTGHDTLEK
jgi:methionine biosynthesis protein MetW